MNGTKKTNEAVNILISTKDLYLKTKNKNKKVEVGLIK